MRISADGDCRGTAKAAIHIASDAPAFTATTLFRVDGDIGNFPNEQAYGPAEGDRQGTAAPITIVQGTTLGTCTGHGGLGLTPDKATARKRRQMELSQASVRWGCP